MASLFSALGRILSGKPVFDPNDQQPPNDNQTPPDPQAPIAPNVPTSPIHKDDASTFPVVQVSRVDTHIDGATMQVDCYLLNNSPVPLLVDKMQLLGTVRTLRDDLRPNQERQYLVYSGPILQSPQYPEARLDYKTATGDYFEANYDVRFVYHQESKGYIVSELRLRPPIRDVYG